MVVFNYQTNFELRNEIHYSKWLESIAISESKAVGEMSYVFCDDDFLHDLNVNYLNHDTLTDIITFDYCDDVFLNGEIYISIDRVKDNAVDFGVDLETELLRVMSHGLLHLCGYEDKTEDDKNAMRLLEEDKMNMFHVKQ